MDRFKENFTEGDNFKHYALGFLERGCNVVQLDPYTINFEEGTANVYGLVLGENNVFVRSNKKNVGELESYDVIMDLSDVVDFNFAVNLDKVNTLHMNPPMATYNSADKKTYIRNYPGVIPKTIVSSEISELEEALYDEFGGEMIVKNPFGSCGRDIEKIDIHDPNYRKILEDLTNGEKKKIIAQKFITFAYEGGKRVAVLGDIKRPESYKIIHFYKRKPSKGNWKDNLSQGGKVIELDSLREDEIELCLNVARKSGLYAVGLDIMDDSDEAGKRVSRLVETNAVLALAFGRYPEKLKKVTDFILEELM